MTILFAGDLDAAEWAAWQAALQAALPGEHLVRDRAEVPAGDIDVALVANPPVGSLSGLPRLRFIQSLWAGVDRLLADASVPVGVPIARMVDPAMNQAMAETALWAVIGLQRGFFRCATRQRDAVWRPPPPRRAAEVSVVVFGLGQMGRATAAALVGHGFQVLGWSARPADVDGAICRSGAAAFAALLARAQVAVNLLPLTEATRGLFDAQAFAAMPAGAGFVNLARGEHVVDADLLAALDGGGLEHAVLDVFHEEPLPASHPFWRHSRVTVLPHTAAPTAPATAAAIAAANIEAFRARQRPRFLVDRERGY